MNSHKEIAIKFVSLVLLCVLVWGDAEVRCIEREREALAIFKNGLKDESGILSSWRGGECCNWYGVVCSNTSTDDGHVIRLELGTGDFDGVLGGKVSSSLLELHDLNYLDLSYNDFGGHPIPEFIGSMKQLRYLYLRNSNFAGIVPPQLGNLTNLRNLSLSRNSLRSDDNLNWLSSLSLLSYLSLGGNDFGGHPIPEFIGSMKKLEHLYLWGCNFSGVFPPQLGNLTNLLTLDLSYNSLKSENLNWLSNLSSLTVLDLSDSLGLNDTNSLQQILNLHSLQELHLQSCNISDVNPSIVNSSSTSLSILDLRENHLTSSAFDWVFNVSLNVVRIELSENALGGLIPNEFERLTHLEYIDLSSNMLEGEVPKSLGNLSHLQALVVYRNHLRGRLDDLIGNLSSKGLLSSLQILDLGRNQFDGPIPDLTVFSALTQVFLGYNNFTGSLPLSVGQLSKLRILEVSSNHLEGVVSESHFTKLHNLEILDLSFNSLSLDIARDWNPPFQLTGLYLAACNMGPSFPTWIQTQKNLWNLDLSSAGIIDQVPMWLWSFSPFHYLFLSNNQISGTIPDLSSIFIQFIDLSSNKISGSIPLFHPNTVSFQLSRNMFSGSISSSICKFPHHELMFLDLSNNQLSGELPNCFEKMPKLIYLNLANNSFSSKMPPSLGSLPDLQTLRLSHNNLSGELPSTLTFCQELRLIDFGVNKLTGEIPSWIGAFYNMQFLNLRSNKFYGGIPPEICNLTIIRVLDISRNNLSGRIPNCFNNLATLAEKDATHVHSKFGFLLYHDYDPQLANSKIIKVYNEYSSFQWKGQESEYRRNLVLLTLIDISSNKLSGTIPHSFSNLRGLISLNLSRNSLTENIIPTIGQMEMLECLDLSHNQLSGQIPMSLTQLHFLSVLDLSNNNLWGKIPSSTQLQSFNMSSYDGNDGLCGRPLALCPEDIPRPSTPTQGEQDHDGLIWRVSFMQGLGISIGFGFIVGFWGAVGSLVLKKSWRYAYFNLLDDVGDWFYVTISIFLSKWKRS